MPGLTSSQEDAQTNEGGEVDKTKFEEWLTSQEFYHGFIPRQDVCSILTKHGDYLVRSTETTYTTKAKEQRRKIAPIICVMIDPENHYDSASENDRLEMIRNLIIHVKSGKTFLDPKLRFDTAADMFAHYTKTSFTMNNKEITLSRAVGLTDWEFQHKNVRVGRMIGKGQFGEVRRGKLILKNGTTAYVAIKSIKTDADISKELIKEVMKEARLMRGLNHPNVVKLYGVGMLDQPLYILLEYVAGGALKSYLRKNKDSITKAEKVQMALGASWGISYLHKSNIIHRDIAARNCLYDHDCAVKISDFGLSRTGTEYKMKTATKMPIRWMAPESIVNYMFTRKTDVYSYGILVYEIFTSKDPYSDIPSATVKKKIIDNELNVFPSDTPEDVSAYVKDKMWNKDPEQREDMEKVVTWLEAYAGLNAMVDDAVDTGKSVMKSPSAVIGKGGVDRKKLIVFKKLPLETQSSLLALKRTLPKVSRIEN
ncbi:hypothetical protein Q1695_002740 [Nippostrongylus brasiliensis]|nr:hypothetical protein Q1695_002740 [Nippostrongylus brasiliensis]